LVWSTLLANELMARNRQCPVLHCLSLISDLLKYLGDG
jgi:hypothetical protein